MENEEPRRLTPEEKAELDSHRGEWLELAAVVLPIEPGFYKDRSGDYWSLAEDGRWTDHTGETRPVEDNWILVASAPFERVNDGR